RTVGLELAVMECLPAPSASSPRRRGSTPEALCPRIVAWLRAFAGLTLRCVSLRRLAVGDTLLDVELEDVVEAVEGAAQGDAPRHLHDLGLGEMGPEPREDLVARAVPAVGDGNRVLDDELVDLVELGMRLVVEEPSRTRL